MAYVYSCPAPNMKATGERIKSLMHQHGLTPKMIARVMGFEHEVAVYNWLKGKSLPKIDNLVILSDLLETPMEKIVVVDHVSITIDEDR